MIDRLNDPNGAIEPALLWMTLDETVVFPDELEWGCISAGAPGLTSSDRLMVVVADDHHLGFVTPDGGLLRIAVFPDEHTSRWSDAIRRTPAMILLRAPHDVGHYASFDDALHHAEVVVVPALVAAGSGADASPPDHS